MDDAGEMSSWYVFSALGLYPFSATDAEYLVTVPLFDEVKWEMSNGKVLTLKKSGIGRNLKFIKVNDKLNEGYFISHDLFRNGGRVEIYSE